jgi:asparagine synthase (glutamine-hydrolysing)
MDEYINLIENELADVFSSYKEKIGDKKVGVLASGGIDSSVVACLLKKYFKENMVLLSFGTKESKDLPYIRILSDFLNLPLNYFEIDSDILQHNLPKVKNILQENKIDINLMQISLASGYYFIFQKAKELNIKHVFTGQGPDIILGGYHKYKNIPDNLIDEEIIKDLCLLKTDKKRDGEVAQEFDIKLFNPYLEKEFINLCLKIPSKYKIKTVNKVSVEKYILRKFGEKIGLPEEIVNRPKMAFQYSTRIQKELKKLLNAKASQVK